jgi:ubiquinone/menaquinone biosynthesis C-methylase UbiE
MHGAKVVALDITVGRVISAQRKLKLVRQGRGCAIQGDAENLPFEDGTFDIVYSFGVLHHTENTEQAISELHRVLKPGGQAAVMLYSKSSYFYLFNQLLVQGILRRNYARGDRWLGKVTEGKPQHSETHNPITRVYTRREMLGLFHRFRSLQLRKSAFNFSQISIIGRFLPKWLVKMGICRESPAGVLVWDGPLRLETRLELILGHYIGFGWNITGRK